MRQCSHQGATPGFRFGSVETSGDVKSLRLWHQARQGINLVVRLVKDVELVTAVMFSSS